MKKVIFLALALVTLAGAAQAQVRGRGPMTNIVRIEIGDDRDDRDMLKRINRLERAVRDLQDKVYDLQSAPQKDEFVCTGRFFSVDGIRPVRSESKMIAIAEVLEQCNRAGGSIFCKEEKVTCERL